MKRRVHHNIGAIALAVQLALSARGSTTNALVMTVAEIDRARILRLANEALALTPPSITDFRATNSAAGPHNFYSQADYYWPNPQTKSGLPYVARDGFTNPDNFELHRLAMRKMKDAVAALAAAYALAGDDTYVAKAQQLLRVFFLDEDTRMNPNMTYAQAVRGSAKGTPLGIIDTLHLAEVAVSIRFLERSSAFDPAVDDALKKWFADYIHWMTTSKPGKREMRAPNNHSIAYCLQLASFSQLVNDQTNLAAAREQFKKFLLPRQMGMNGSFRLELRRTKPFNYSTFQAENIATLCVLLSTPDDDLWKFVLPKGETPLKSTEFIYPYIENKQKWLNDGRGKDVMHWDSWPVRQSCLIFAYAETGEAQYFNLWTTLDPDPTDLEIRRNISITQPLLWLAQPSEVPLLPP